MRHRHLDFEPDRPATSTLPLDPIVQLWILRILLPLGGLHRLLMEGVGSMPLLERVGVRPREIDDEATPATRERHIKRQLKPLWDRAERSAGEIGVPQALADNVARLAALVHLSEAECRILEFVCLLHGVRELDDAADNLGRLSTARIFTMLQHILGLPADAVKQALSPRGQLARSGLVKTEGLLRDDVLCNKLELLSEQFVDTILAPDADPMTLLRGVIARSAPPTLQLDDYPHLGLNLQMLLAYLREAQAQQRPGVNVLLYGPPDHAT
ncbi:Putative ATPases of the AAA+ class (fragment) [Thiomonas sp. X19]|uniref:hypothetical protein n=1 Tax=Thiomonas sp. X19 TaxID=1050370 RepID=UPI000B650440